MHYHRDYIDLRYCSSINFVQLANIGVARIFSGGALVPQKVNDRFLVVVLNTRAKTA